MKCKDCNTPNCAHRTSDAEQECIYSSIQNNTRISKDMYESDKEQIEFRKNTAVKFMAAMIASDSFAHTKIGITGCEYREKWTAEEMAQTAVSYTDVLINELKK